MIVRGVLQMPQLPQSFWPEYLTKVGNPKVACRVTLRRAVVAAIDEASPDPFDSVHIVSFSTC
jgi:hypothetical protein